MSVIVAKSSSSGGGGSPSTPSYKIPFGFGNPSPELIGLLPAGSIVESVSIVIFTPFNGTGASLTVGDSGDYSRLMGINANAPTISSTFKSYPGYTYVAAANTYISIVPGSGATQGSGEVVINLI